jgi:hypothetical protein
MSSWHGSTLVVPGKVCRNAPTLLPRDGASAVHVSRYEAQAKDTVSGVKGSSKLDQRLGPI